MIGLFLLDILINRITIYPSFIFLIGLLKSRYYSVLICALIMDLVLVKLPFNIGVLSVLYLINKKFFKRKKFLKNYYLVNLFNLVVYYTVGFFVYNNGLYDYLLSIFLITVFNSILWFIGYSFYKPSYN